MKWIHKKFGKDWITRCPYCGQMQRGKVNLCNRESCKAIFSEDLYKKFGKISKILSKKK